VDYLGLKPHFAVQIFERATTEMPKEEVPGAAASAEEAERPAPRRHLDL